MRYHKLVRDKIPEIIRGRGDEVKSHIAGGAEYWQKLKEKLQEEIGEFLEAESEEEIADVLEVIDAIVTTKGWSQVREKQKEKALARGKFEKKIILEEA